ncbi:MAG: hypothetical protein V4650_14685 [Pseudomonadota bacterium]
MTPQQGLAVLTAVLLTLALPAEAAKKSAKKSKPAAEAVAAAPAAETAQVIRETALKKEPFSDAETISTLPEKTIVQILKRQGAWMQVQAGEASGWLRLLSLRTAAASTVSGDSGLTQAINIARSGASGNTVATGVRGLSKEQISNATPDLAELETMRSHAADEAGARAFAAAAPATTAEVQFLDKGDQ